MRNVCYAKPINGGYSIIGFNVRPYTVAQLPSVCQHSGQPVILLESAHNFIQEVSGKASNALATFKGKLQNIWNELVQDVKVAREEWDEAKPGSDNSETSDLIAQYLTYLASSRAVATLANESGVTSERVGQMIDGLCQRKFEPELKKAGFELPRTRQAPIATLQGLLNAIFGQVTGIHDIQTDTEGENAGKMASVTDAVTA